MRNVFSINFKFFFICFFNAINKHTDHSISDRFLKRYKNLSVNRHDLKVSSFVRSEDYTQVCDQEFNRARKISYNKGISIKISSTTHERKPHRKPF